MHLEDDARLLRGKKEKLECDGPLNKTEAVNEWLVMTDCGSVYAPLALQLTS